MKNVNIYQKKIEAVLKHIKYNLSDELNVNGLAELVHMSPFHFHRIYGVFMQETVYDTILRLRMEAAIFYLTKNPNQPIIEVALDVGFNNPSSFSRAFKRYFGFSPTDVRSKKHPENSKISTLKSKYGKELSVEDLYPKDVVNIKGDRAMKVEIKQQPERSMIYLPTDYTHDQMMSTWLNLNRWFHENKGHTVQKWDCVGLYYNDPTITPLDKCRAELCLLTDQPVQLGNPFTSSKIPAGKYAVTRYTIPEEHRDKWTDEDFEADDWHNFIQSFYKNWLVTSGHEADEYPLMMSYNVLSDVPREDQKGAKFFDIESIDLMIKLKG